MSFSAVQAIRDYSRWLSTLRETLQQSRRSAFSIVVAASVISRISHLIAFLLPLKIILLLGSNGVPRYFTSFVDPEHKTEWIIFLSIGAVVSYLFSLAADWMSQRYIQVGTSSLDHLISLWRQSAQQQNLTKICYGRVTKLTGELLVALVLLLVGYLVNLQLFAFLSACLITQCIMTLSLPSNRKGRMARFVDERPSAYFTILGSVDFLLVFVFLLATFLMGSQFNALMAIISVIVSRQILASLQSFAIETYYLIDSRQDIDDLFIADSTSNPLKLDIERQILNLPNRLNRVANAIGESSEQIESNWRDSDDKSLFTFEVAVGVARYWEVVYPPSLVDATRREDWLFGAISPESLRTSSAISSYTTESFVSRIYPIKPGAVPVSPQKWKSIRREMLAQHWRVAPPDHLTSHYRRTQRLVHERLSGEVFDTLALTATSRQQRLCVSNFARLYPDIKERVADLPLFIFNQRMSPRTTLVERNGDYWSIGWGYWTIEPVGAGLVHPRSHIIWMNELCQDFPGISPLDLMIVADLTEFERLFMVRKYQRALALLEPLMESFLGSTPNEVGFESANNESTYPSTDYARR